jgi:membrane protein
MSTTARTPTSDADQDEREPDSPTDLTTRSKKFVLRKTLSEFSDDQCTDLAAALTYYAVLALFPAAIALTSILGLVGQGPSAVNEVLKILEQIGAGGVVDSVGPTLRDLSASQGAGLAFVLGLAGALWSASGYVGAFGRAMNRIYEIDEGRPFWKLKPQQLLVTVITVVLVTIVALILVVSGPVTRAIGDALGLGSAPRIAWEIAKWPLLLIVVVLIIAILYYAAPNARQPKFRWISMGAIIAIVVLAVATFLFAFYVATFANYEKTYGPLAGVIVFLLWVWIANLALLFGAEFDAETERGRELQAGMEAEETIQLPPRDTRLSEKSADKEEALIDEARRVREDADASDDR